MFGNQGCVQLKLSWDTLWSSAWICTFPNFELLLSWQVPHFIWRRNSLSGRPPTRGRCSYHPVRLRLPQRSWTTQSMQGGFSCFSSQYSFPQRVTGIYCGLLSSCGETAVQHRPWSLKQWSSLLTVLLGIISMMSFHSLGKMTTNWQSFLTCDLFLFGPSVWEADSFFLEVIPKAFCPS